jgi:elongation factor Ts
MVSINLIKKLRNITSLGIAECKDALVKSKGDIDLAIEDLYNKGTIKYTKSNAKKLGFVNVLLNEEKNAAVIIEFNTQTDFVSKNSQFLNFVSNVTKVCLIKKIESIPNLLTEYIGEKTVEQHQKILINQFKENIFISRLKFIQTTDGIIGTYLHSNKIASLVIMNKNNSQLSHDIAIHVAAMNPEYIKVKDIKSERIEKEKSILMDQIKKQHSNKNDSILNRIVEGKLNKLFQEIVLYKQIFVKDKNKSIENLLKENKSEISYICRFEVEKT